jgi:2-C-methyl-D-erythritol 4-phosphate cytidylyltransferase/2-C-methyl-D-erythritol 2,4-cyclodiphosphate synthase
MYHVIITAAGKGERFGSPQNKIWHPISGRPMIAHTIKTFEQHPQIDNIIITYHPDDEEMLNELIKKEKFSKIRTIVPGKETRQKSVFEGLKKIKKESNNKDFVIVHNAANPLFSNEELSNFIKKQQEHPHIGVGRRVTKSLKKVKDCGTLDEHIDRQNTWEMETPQGSTIDHLFDVYEKSINENYQATDETELLQKYGHKVVILETHPQNIKVTHPHDIHIAEHNINKETPNIPYRTGFGHDSHRFLKEYDPQHPFTLGGVVFEDKLSFDANSDGDVVLHTIFNAISQALGLRSIGYYCDKMCLEKGITDSKVYLIFMLEKMRELDYNIGNLGISIEAKQPRLEAKIPAMISMISEICDIDESQVGIVATSGEELTDFGRGEGMQVFVTCILYNI